MSEYRVHRFDLRMTKDEGNLERFLNSLEGDVVSVVPNVTMKAFWVHVIDFVYVVERLPGAAQDCVADEAFDAAASRIEGARHLGSGSR